MLARWEMVECLLLVLLVLLVLLLLLVLLVLLALFDVAGDSGIVWRGEKCRIWLRLGRRKRRLVGEGGGRMMGVGGRGSRVLLIMGGALPSPRQRKEERGGTQLICVQKIQKKTCLNGVGMVG